MPWVGAAQIWNVLFWRDKTSSEMHLMAARTAKMARRTDRQILLNNIFSILHQWIILPMYERPEQQHVRMMRERVEWETSPCVRLTGNSA